MISNKIVASVAVAIMMSVCIAPMMAEGSDGATAIRSAETAVYEGTFEKISGTYVNAFYNSFYFLEGSDNHKAMMAYIADPTNRDNKVVQDDSQETLRNIGWGGTVHVYTWRQYLMEGVIPVATTGETNINADLKKTMDSYGRISFFVKAGDTVKISMTATNNYGEDAEPYFFDTDYVKVDPSAYEGQFKASFNIVIHFDNGGLYSEVSYDVSGISQPGGSATTYFIFCAIVTVLVLAILAYAALKPKWSK